MRLPAAVQLAAILPARAVTYLFLADTTTMTDEARPLLAVDLCIANMDFADYADAADGSATCRGFDEE